MVKLTIKKDPIYDLGIKISRQAQSLRAYPQVLKIGRCKGKMENKKKPLGIGDTDTFPHPKGALMMFPHLRLMKYRWLWWCVES